MRKLIFFLILVFNQSSFAIENSHFLILKYDKVNVRYGPGMDYDVKYIYKKKYLPVKVIEKNKKVSIVEPINDEVSGATNHCFFLKRSNI